VRKNIDISMFMDSCAAMYILSTYHTIRKQTRQIGITFGRRTAMLCINGLIFIYQRVST